MDTPPTQDHAMSDETRTIELLITTSSKERAAQTKATTDGFARLDRRLTQIAVVAILVLGSLQLGELYFDGFGVTLRTTEKRPDNGMPVDTVEQD